MQKIIGIDIGGTKISVVLADKKGKIIEKKLLNTKLNKQSRDSIREVQDTVNLLLFDHRVQGKALLGIGISAPGPVDPKTGSVGDSPNLPGWKGIKLKDMFKKKFKAPVFVENDANASALAEKFFGSAKKLDNFIYITASTGIGSGIVIRGEVVDGASFSAGEIGHMTVMPMGQQCNCGKRGCLEAMASGTAIAKQARRLLADGGKSKILKIQPEPTKITAKDVSAAAVKGDELAKSLMRNAGHFLGIAVGNVMNLLNPEMIILGGSVLKTGKAYWQAMKKTAKREAWPNTFKACKIVKTELGDKVADIGAVSLVLEGLNKKK